MVVRYLSSFLTMVWLASSLWANPTISALEQHLKHSPKDWRRRRRLISLLLKKKAHRRAAAQIEQLLETKPKAYKYRCKLGALWWRAGKRDEAIAQWHQVLHQRPGNELARRYLERVGVPPVEKHRLRVQWNTGPKPYAYTLEMTHAEQKSSAGASPFEATSHCRGKLLMWDGGQTKAGTRVALRTVIERVKMPRGFFDPQPSVFGFPRAGSAQTRVLDDRGRIHGIGGVETRDWCLYERPWFVLPDQPVGVGEGWQEQTTSTAFYLHTELGRVQSTWHYRLTTTTRHEDGSLAVITGQATHHFLDKPHIGKTLKITDGCELAIGLETGTLFSYVHNVIHESYDPRTKERLRLSDGIGLRTCPTTETTKPTIEPYMVRSLAPPSTTRPTKEAGKAFLHRFYGNLFYGHTDKLALHCIDFHNLTDAGGDQGLLYRNTSKLYRTFLVGRVLKGLQRLAADLDSSAAPAAVEKEITKRVASYELVDDGARLLARGRPLSLTLHRIKGKVRVAALQIIAAGP